MGQAMSRLLGHLPPRNDPALGTLNRIFIETIRAIGDTLLTPSIDQTAAAALGRLIDGLPHSVHDAAPDGLAIAEEAVSWIQTMDGLQEAKPRLRALIDAAIARGDERTATRCKCRLALTQAVDGDLQQASNTLRRMAPRDLHTIAGPVVIVDRDLTEVLIDLGRLNAADASKLLHASMLAHPGMVQISMAHYARLRAALLDQDHAARYKALTWTSERTSPGDRYQAMAIAARAELALSAGQLDRAAEILNQSRLANHNELLPPKARLSLMQGHPRKALIDAQRALIASRAIPRLRCDALVIMALAHITSGTRTDANQALEELAAIVEESGNMSCLAMIPADIRPDVAERLSSNPRVALTVLDPRCPAPFPPCLPASAHRRRSSSCLPDSPATSPWPRSPSNAEPRSTPSNGKPPASTASSTSRPARRPSSPALPPA